MTVQDSRQDSRQDTRHYSQSQPSNQLRKNSLGVGAITFLVVSAAAPLTAVAGGVPLSMLLGNGPGIPLTFVLVTLILLLFAVGYVAGTPRVAGVSETIWKYLAGAAILATAYAFIQVALFMSRYGGIG